MVSLYKESRVLSLSVSLSLFLSLSFTSSLCHSLSLCLSINQWLFFSLSFNHSLSLFYYLSNSLSLKCTQVPSERGGHFHRWFSAAVIAEQSTIRPLEGFPIGVFGVMGAQLCNLCRCLFRFLCLRSRLSSH